MSLIRFLLGACFLTLSAASAPVHASQPNIIFILCDDLGYGDLGAIFQNSRAQSGKPHLATPHLDGMAREGLHLRRHYVAAPVCAPARASLLTGMHQGHASVRDNQFDKALADNHTLGSVLREGGYATAAVGKWGLQGEGESPDDWEAYPTKRGFDHFFGYVRHRDGHNHYPAHEAPARPPVELYSEDKDISAQLEGCYTTDLFTAEAKRWITAQKKERPEQPFFVYLAYDTPHAGLQVAAAPYPEGGGLHGGLQWLGKPGRAINTAEESIDDYIHPDYAVRDWPEPYKRFASMVRRIDDGVGDLFQLLRDLEIDSETLVVFTSDNGPHTESYGYGDYEANFFESFGPLDGIKRDVLEGGIRVPTLARWPGRVPPGESTDTPSQFHDWLPTLADLAGLPAPAQSDGVSLVPTLTASGDQKESTIYVEYQHGARVPGYEEFEESRRNRKRGQMQAVYEGGYKGVRYQIRSPDDDFEIYDTRTDPGEARNLAGEGDEFERLQRVMKDRVLQLRRPDPTAPRPYDAAAVPAAKAPENLDEGLRFRLYHASPPWIPDVATLGIAPAQTGVTLAIDLRPDSGADDALLEYSGLLRIEEPGEYTFTLAADQGAVLRLHDILLIDAGRGERAGEDASATIHLDKGYHPVRLTCARKNETTSSLALHWSGPGFSSREIAADFLAHNTASE